MRRTIIVLFLAAVPTIIAGCRQGDASLPPVATIRHAETKAPAEKSFERKSGYKNSSYEPPTTEEMAPMRPEYLAELAKIHEPPEMTDKPMEVRKPAPPDALKVEQAMGTLGSPDKATHEQRATAIRELLDVVNNKKAGDRIERSIVYAAVADIACLDGAEPQTVIGYATDAIGGDSDDALALRARMYLKAGDRDKALNDLEKVMANRDGHPLVDGETDPRKVSAPCGWSIPDFDVFGDDPRALAAKGLYLASFIGYGAEHRGTVKGSDIRELYARAAKSWRSPLPHFLQVTLDGIGSEHSMAGARCIRANSGGGIPDLVEACAKHDEGIREQIRELTMALVIEPTFTPALSERAEKYLQLAQASYADGKPSRRLFELAISDYTAAIAAGGKGQHSLYCDRALALASLGRYQDAAAGYLQGMKYAKSGVEDSPFIYQQLAGLYMKLGKFNEAANLMTQAIINSSGGGIDAVIFLGGMRSFRTLYPEYELLPDDILAEDIRRRYQPQFPQSWDAEFISQGNGSNGGIPSSILPDLYAMRGDAYMKAGRRAEALADYHRVETDAWMGNMRSMYFDERGNRNHDQPEPWPPPPPKL